jgi:hypothetical protein
MVHVGKGAIDVAWLATLLSDIRTILYFFDYHQGQDWAAESGRASAPKDAR